MKLPAHSLLGASGAHRWLSCPGSFHLSVATPPGRASIYAATGSVAHAYIEKAIEHSLQNSGMVGTTRLGPDDLGRVVAHDGHDVVVDQALIDGVNTMLEYIMRTAPDCWLRYEFRVHLDDYFLPDTPPVPLFGQVDVALLNEHTDTLEIIDYKNGAGVLVSPRDNPQMLYYAAGVLQYFPAPELAKIKRVKLTIVQPNAPGVEPIRSWETSPLDLLMWVDDVLVPGVHACDQPDAPLVPGAWCRFCPALRSCPRLRQDATAMAQRDFADALPADPNDLAAQLDIADRAVTWANAIQAYALEQLRRQVRIPGWTMVPTRPTRQWIDDETVVAAALGVAGVPDDVIWETRLRSPAQVEKKVSCRVWSPVSDTLVHSVSSGMKLARDDRSDAGQEFE